MRRDVLPAWIAGGSRGNGSRNPNQAPVFPIQASHHTLGEVSPFTITLRDRSLELRDEQEVLNLVERLRAIGVSVNGEVPVFLPSELPAGYGPEDVLGGSPELSSQLGRAAELWKDQLAYFRSPRLGDESEQGWTSTGFESDWGVFVHAGGVEKIARDVYLRLGFNHEDALGYAFADLLEHELIHAALDIAAIRLEAAVGPLPTLGAHSCAPCLAEEALCEAQAVRTARARAEGEGLNPVLTAQLRMASAMTGARSSGLPGYSDWFKVIDEPGRAAAVDEVLAHDGVPTLLRRALLDETIRSGIWVTDVPVYLIMDPGTAAEKGAWAPGFAINV